MNKVFVDTNIVLDLLGQRIDFYKDSQDLFTYAIDNKVTLVVSSLTFANTNYILKEQLKLGQVRSSLRKLSLIHI